MLSSSEHAHTGKFNSYKRPVTQCEFFIFIGIIIFSGAVGKGGKNLFEKEQDR
jgi:hypothetical protein